MSEPYESDPLDENPSDQDWAKAAECFACDLDNFEAYIWPVFRERGVTKDTGMICFYLHLIVANIQELRDGHPP
jgi:hypothetical protein